VAETIGPSEVELRGNGVLLASAPPDAPHDTPDKGPSGRRWIAAVAALVVVALIAGLVWFVRARHHAHATSLPRQVTLAPANAALAAPGTQSLLALLQHGAGETVHATYRAAGDARVIGDSLTIEVWQAAPQFREDTVQVRSGHRSHIEQVNNQVCTQVDSAPWSCRTVAADATRTGLAGLASLVTTTLTAPMATAASTTRAGQSASCYAETAATVKLCVNKAGIPVVLADRDVSYELTALSSAVPSGTFNPPATR
jgi:hypothetical protein